MTGRPAREQPTETREQAAYRQYLDHTLDCLDCDSPTGCAPGAELRQAWRDQRGH
ncbi:hypothetical protein [Streptomyces californicus]|uniref:hypothetical protein n=1 Tax=Streptomyces californicus TaxID=67351 RepID=UPI000B24FBE8|nr:hypothetical protein [Streptomyces californicus]QRV56607.1 hypothetical protein I6J40_22225 [Streptomyces californicus]